MAELCVIAPKKGFNTFLLLKSKFGYATAWAIFNKASHPNFIEAYGSNLKLDNEGIPTYESMLQNWEIQDIIGQSNLINEYQSRFENTEDTLYNYENLVMQARLFNDEHKHEDVIAVVLSESDDKGNNILRVRIKERTPLNIEIFEELFGTIILNREIQAQLELALMRVSYLNLDLILIGLLGRIDFSQAKNILGDMISIANNHKGAVALSEEFAHLCIEVFKNHRLVKRGINSLSDDDIRDILGNEYDSYVQMYGEDSDKLREEALGHLLLTAFYDNSLIPKRQKSLIERIFEFIKTFFRCTDPRHIQNTLDNSRYYMNEFARSILSGDMQITRQHLHAIDRVDDLYSLEELTSSALKILQEGIDRELKIGKITNNMSISSFVSSLLPFANKDADTALGIAMYLNNAIHTLQAIDSAFHTNVTAGLRSKFRYLRKILNYHQLYAQPIKDLRVLLEASREDDNLKLFSRTDFGNGLDANTIENLVNELDTLNQLLMGRYLTVAKPALVQFFKPFLGENVVNPFENDPAKKGSLTIESLFECAESDIGWMDKWLTSMSESSDVLLLLFDLAAKKAKDEARLKTIELGKKILSAYLKAKTEGVTDFTFMYRYDDKGNRTQFYIGSLEELDKLSLAEHDFYTTFMTLKNQLDELLGDDRANLGHVILMKKHHSFGSLGLLATGKFALFGEAMKDKVFERDYDDLEEGKQKRSALTDLEGKEYMLLPKYYLRDLEDLNEVSDDPIGSLIAYAYMAYNFDKMDDIVDALETGRNFLKETRKIKQTRGDLALVEAFKWAGFETENPALVEWDKSNIALKLDKFFNSLIYGRYLLDQGILHTPLGDLSALKVTSTILGWASTLQLGCNWLANIANVTNGIAMTNIEAFASQYFNKETLFEADKIYGSLIGDYIANLGNPVKNDKLSLICEYFDVQQDFNESTKRRYDQGLLTKIFGPNFAFIGLGAGDHWLYSRVVIALMLNTKAYDNEGNESNVYEALNMVTDENGIVRLQIKKGWTIPSIADNTTTGASGKVIFTTLSRKAANINLKLFGVYNQDDAVAALQVCLGRLALQYRKWMAPALNKRFLKAQYNSTLDVWEEGYYRTGFKFLSNLYNELKKGDFLWEAYKQTLTLELKANLKRIRTEVLQYGLVLIGLGMIEIWGPADKKKRPWALKMLEYQLYRLKTELGVLIPGKSMLLEGLRIIDAPAAGLSYLETITDALEAVTDWESWVKPIKSGPYKGWTKVEKTLYKATPYAENIKRFTSDIDNALKFYTQDNK